jgi:hypothetical protein
MADLIYSGPPQSAGAAGTDPTLVSGQDPSSEFGIDLSYSTGAGGSPAGGAPADPTTEPNQYPPTEPLSGVPLGGTGAPGTSGAPAGQIEEPGASVMVTDPNYTSGKPGGGSGTQMVSAPVGDASTGVAGQYPPANPLVPGDFYPTSDGVGQGNVLVGGYKKGQRG